MAMLEVGDARRSMDAQQAGEMGVGGTVYPNTAPYRYQSLDGPASTQWGPGGYGDPNYVDPQYAAYYAQQQGYEYDPHMANQYMQSHPQAPQQYQNAPWAQQQQAYGSAAGSAAGLAHNRSAGSQSAVSSAPTRVQSSTGYNPTLPQEKQDALARNASASAYSTASHPQSSSPILGPQQAKDHAHTDVAAPDPNARSGSPVSATSLHGGPGLHLVNPEQASIDEENDR